MNLAGCTSRAVSIGHAFSKSTGNHLRARVWLSRYTHSLGPIGSCTPCESALSPTQQSFNTSKAGSDRSDQGSGKVSQVIGAVVDVHFGTCFDAKLILLRFYRSFNSNLTI